MTRLRAMALLLIVGGVLWLLVSQVAQGRGTDAAAETAPPAVAPATTPTSPTTVSPDVVPSRTGGDDTEPTEGPDRAWTDTADAFLTAYLTGPRTNPAAWRAALRPLVSDTLAAGFASTDPRNVPTAPLDTATVVLDYAEGGGVVRATLTDDTRILVTVTTGPDGAARVVDVRDQP